MAVPKLKLENLWKFVLGCLVWIAIAYAVLQSKELFLEHCKPLEEQVAQLDIHLPKLEAEIDVRLIQLASHDTVRHEATTLYERWAEMPFPEKRAIVETITSGVVIGQEEIEISFAHEKPFPSNDVNNQRDFMGSCLPPA